MRTDAIFFDFDGVLVESLDIKTAAFRALFADHPEHVDTIARYHLENLGLCRYDKFRWVYRMLLRRPLTPRVMGRLGRAFSCLVLDGVLGCPLVAGTREFLETFAPRAQLFVVSATPDAELRRIVERRGLTDYFQAVRGGPRSKRDLLAQLLRRHGLDAGRCVFVGDAPADAAAARANGIPFVQRLTSLWPRPFGAGEIAAISDLTQLAGCLARRRATGGRAADRRRAPVPVLTAAERASAGEVV